MIGQEILGYIVKERIGAGGFGTVYKVEKTNVSGTYIRALKHITLPSQKQYLDVLNSMGGDKLKADNYFDDILKNIINEIQIISSLSEADCNNIVRYYENDIVENRSPRRYDIYIMMELLTPFTDYSYRKELKVKDIIKLGKDILTALVFCHNRNVIHRDIKDDNIFVSSDGVYKLGDFGVSKVLKDHSKAESMKGTPNFIAPEVYLGKEKYDATVDLYSLGIVLYKMLNKSRNPFLPEFPATYNSDDEDIAFERRMKCETPDLPYCAKNILGEAVVKAIKGRTERYNSAKEFLEALNEAEGQLSDEELEVVVNQVIDIEPVKNIKTEVLEMDKTIGDDMIVPSQKQEITNTDENNLFKEFNKTEINFTDTTEKEDDFENDKKKNNKWIVMLCIGILAIVGIIMFFVFSSKGNDANNEDIVDTQVTEAPQDDTEEEPVEELISVPSVVNYESEVAKNIIEMAELQYVVDKEIYSDNIEAQRVITQNPESGKQVEKDCIVHVIISKGSETVEVPDVKNLSKNEAKQLIEESELKVKIKESYNDEIIKGKVISQSVSAGQRVERGTVITIKVSKGTKSKPDTDKPATNNNNSTPNNNNKGNSGSDGDWDLQPGF